MAVQSGFRGHERSIANTPARGPSRTVHGIETIDKALAGVNTEGVETRHPGLNSVFRIGN